MTILTSDLQEIKVVSNYRPAVSVILPFEPKMSLKSELTHSLKMVADRVGKELKDNYPPDIAMLVIEKLRSIISGLSFSTHKKSIVIYVSPVFEKVLYLDITVEEKIIIDESFEIRDVVYCKKQTRQYLVLVISGKESKMYLGNGTSLVKIVNDAHGSVYDFVNDVPEPVSNYSDISSRKETILNKFLHQVDASLHIILNAYHLPVFVLGPEKVAGHFKSLTKHANNVIDYIYGNYDDATTTQLATRLAPHLEQWERLRQNNLLHLLEMATSTRRLAIGIRDVWREAANSKGRLLLVEKDYMYAAQRGSSSAVIYMPTKPYNKFSHIKDAVDDIIEKVLESGGDVEFVAKDLLKEYHHIALVQYY